MFSPLPDCHKGSARILLLVALAMAIIGGWWGLVMVPKNKAAEASRTHDRIEALVASKSFLSFPGSKLTCDAMGGNWRIGQDTQSVSSIVTRRPEQDTPSTVTKKQRIRTPDYCSMPASDAGKACMSSSECESFCVGRMALGELFTAQCHPYRNASPNSFGSMLVVEKGRPSFNLSFTSEGRRTPDTYEVMAAKMKIEVVDGSKLKVGEKVRATKELRERPWFPSFGIPGT